MNDQDLPWLDPPYHFLDLAPGEEARLVVKSLEVGRTPPAPEPPSASGPFTTARLHLDPARSPGRPPYQDVVGRKVAEALRGALAQPPPAGAVVVIRRSGAVWPPAYSISIAPA